MAYQTPTAEPAEVRAGDTVTWLKTLADYPASQGWTLYYRLINVGAKIDITTTASGDLHLVNEAAATTDDWDAGSYDWVSWVTDGVSRYSIGSGKITVLPDLAAVSATGYDTRSQAKKMLDAIDAALLSLSSGERLAIVEAELTTHRMKYDITGLHNLRNLYAAQVRAEENAERAKNGLPSRNKLLVRF